MFSKPMVVKRIESGVRKDEVGWYAFADFQTVDSTSRRETLRTKDKKKAERWLRQGLCHGWQKHSVECQYCDK